MVINVVICEAMYKKKYETYNIKAEGKTVDDAFKNVKLKATLEGADEGTITVIDCRMIKNKEGN